MLYQRNKWQIKIYVTLGETANENLRNFHYFGKWAHGAQ
jgi:hypothetical protein